ncbi:Lrp/AsnC family transcriptional regulator [Streptomyces sp. NPDC057743]|uniref:Lrp/AsnC family transcriptional regulator n=1 Tax=Streptomyces sp. NPDC057743 TaxID=3346236 RepID=UPI00368D321C
MTPPISQPPSLDPTDRALLRLLADDGRATYQELARAVQLSPNAVAERVRRLRRSGLIRGYTLDIAPDALGQALRALTNIKLREGVSRRHFEAGLSDLPQVIAAAHTTGEYDYELTIGCREPTELEEIVDRLKDHHGVREVNSRIILREVPLDPLRILEDPPNRRTPLGGGAVVGPPADAREPTRRLSRTW